MKYDKFKYLYPPRPEYKCPSVDLDKYDNGEYIGQPKYNGSCCIVFTNGKDLEVYNRHKEKLSLLTNYKEIDFRGLAQTNNWYVFAGEYLNKGKLGETGEKERNKFIIWDGKHLVGETVQTRLELLEDSFPCQRARVGIEKMEMYDHLCCTELEGIYKAPSYTGNFKKLFTELVKVDMYEGFVLKKKDAKLTFGLQELNNHDWQLKCRKETKLYKF